MFCMPLLVLCIMCSVVEPEPPFLAGAGAVKKGAAPAPAQCPAVKLCLKIRDKQMLTRM